ncbi:hypothetical protein BAJUN_02650 [Bajunvirus bajun]|uniref:Uncharacterized protein n=1 Tax=Brevundimonas phage vB_BgoS-Bajun TaxID=2948594 RepID=A0A9E7STE0_9CAUD|nr:hypothetical protein BAJUN_02650 [Brevundimonas phage vB_BgoS-Bajun]
MSQDNLQGFPASPGDPLIVRMLAEMQSSQTRTREDTIEIKGAVKSMSEAVTRVEKRQEAFEKEVDQRIESEHRKNNAKMVEIAREVKTIREERIAEKAQWRGPEKVIGILVLVASALGAIVAIKAFFFP